MTGCTDFPLGVFKWIPFKIHGAIEVMAGLFLIVAPWLFGFSGLQAARSFFVALGIITFVVVALTDYAQRVKLPPPQPGDRRRFRPGEGVVEPSIPADEGARAGKSSTTT